jgi:predicted outer membrane protein
MRLVPLAAGLLFLLAPCANAIDERPLDAQTIAALVQRATTAQPKEQCFLYAEIVHQLTELAGRELAAGDIALATASLRAVGQYADKIHMGVADDNKRLKNAEILVRHTSFRLQEILHGASIDDRPMLQATLKQLDQVQSEMMLQVFRK